MAPSTGSPASGDSDGKGSEAGSDAWGSNLELDSNLPSLMLDDLLRGGDEDASIHGQDLPLQPSIQQDPRDLEFFAEQHMHQEHVASEPAVAGPEMHWLANHIMNRQSAVPGPVQIEEIIERIISILLPRIRERGFSGTTTEELIGNFNARLRGEIPLAPSASESSSSGPASFVGSDWKMKDRPVGLKYNKRSGKKPARKRGSKSLDVRIVVQLVSLSS